MAKTETNSPDLDNESKITLGLLNMVHENSLTSQRSMAGDLGIALGLGLGSLISWNLINDIGKEFEGLSFSVPWLTVAVIVAAAYVFSFVTTFWPARQASRIYPAEALRYE